MKNCVLKGVLALSLASSFALAEGGFAGVELRVAMILAQS